MNEARSAITRVSHRPTRCWNVPRACAQSHCVFVRTKKRENSGRFSQQESAMRVVFIQQKSELRVLFSPTKGETRVVFSATRGARCELCPPNKGNDASCIVSNNKNAGGDVSFNTISDCCRSVANTRGDGSGGCVVSPGCVFSNKENDGARVCSNKMSGVFSNKRVVVIVFSPNVVVMVFSPSRRVVEVVFSPIRGMVVALFYRTRKW